MSQPSVVVINPKRFRDSRGWFEETYNREAFARLGIHCSFVQDNYSYSAIAYTLRGLHFQRPPQAQAKLVRCIRGRIFDVAIDLRQDSPAYGEVFSVELSADNGLQVYIPIGFAHGFLTMEEDCEIAYKCSDIYSPRHDDGIAWDSAGVDWPLAAGVTPVLSEKDQRLTPLSQFTSPFTSDSHSPARAE